MGFFDKVLGGSNADRTEPQEESDSNSSPFDFAAWTDKDLVDVDRRADIVLEHYDEVDEDQARVVAEQLKAEFEDPDGHSTSSLRDRFEGELDLSDELLHTIAWTESASINLMETVGRYYERGEGRYEYKIVVPDDDRTHPICSEASEEIEERGGVPMDKVAHILKSKAEQYEEEGGTPQRMDHWVPHERCRHTVTRHVDI